MPHDLDPVAHKLIPSLALALMVAVQSAGADPPPVVHLEVVSPTPMSVEVSPVTFTIYLASDEPAAVRAAYRHRWMCIEVDDKDTSCIRFNTPDFITMEVSEGPHIARAFAADVDMTKHPGVPLYPSAAAAFNVVSEAVYADYVQRQSAAAAADLQEMAGLLRWAATFRSNASSSMSCPASSAATNQCDFNARRHDTHQSPFLVIGVKTSLVSGFLFRQAIRETWADLDSTSATTKVLFAGCRLAAGGLEAADRQSIDDALELEKRVFGDLLTHELDCVDSYSELPEKVKEFMHFVARHNRYRYAKYVMIADDDIYLRVPEFVHDLQAQGELRNMYAGPCESKPFLAPDRDPSHKYYLPESVYPMGDFPPFALGPHYLLSMDCVEFIADNRRELRGLNGLDDVSVALWMLIIQVHAQNIDYFKSLRFFACRDVMISLADLSPIAIRAIHANLRSGRSLCDGFSRITWDKSVIKAWSDV